MLVYLDVLREALDSRYRTGVLATDLKAPPLEEVHVQHVELETPADGDRRVEVVSDSSACFARVGLFLTLRNLRLYILLISGFLLFIYLVVAVHVSQL